MRVLYVTKEDMFADMEVQVAYDWADGGTWRRRCSFSSRRVFPAFFCVPTPIDGSPCIKQEQRRMSVYFITRNDLGHVKIGTSDDAQRRFVDLSSAWSTDDLVLSAVIPGGYLEENVLHHRFDEEWIKGEWFRLSQRIEAVITEANLKGDLHDVDWFAAAVAERRLKAEALKYPEHSFFVERLKRIREERGLKQADLAAMAGLPRSTVANVEAPTSNPTLNVLWKLSKALNLRIGQLLGEE